MEQANKQSLKNQIPRLTFLGIAFAMLVVLVVTGSTSYWNARSHWQDNVAWTLKELRWTISQAESQSKADLEFVIAHAGQHPQITYIRILSGNSNLVSYSRSSEENAFPYSKIQADLALDQQADIITTDSTWGLYTAYSPIVAADENRSEPLLLVVSYDFSATIILLIEQMIAIVIVMLLLSLSLFSLAKLQTKKLLLKPIASIAQMAMAAHKRNYGDAIKVSANKEITTLANAVNDMQRRVKVTIDDLEHNQLLYRIFANALPQACAMVKMDGSIVTNFGPEDTLFASVIPGSRIMDYVPNHSDIMMINKIRDCHGMHKTLHAEVNIGTEDMPVHYDFSFTPVTEPVVGEPVTLITAQNISQRKTHEQTLSLLASVFESREAIAITNANNQIIRVNQEFCRVTGYSEADLIKCNPDTYASTKHDSRFWETIWAEVLLNGSWVGELTIQTRDGVSIPIRQTVSTVRNGQGVVENFVIVFSDISEQKKTMALVRYHANFDTLTDLPNPVVYEPADTVDVTSSTA